MIGLQKLRDDLKESGTGESKLAVIDKLIKDSDQSKTQSADDQITEMYLGVDALIEAGYGNTSKKALGFIPKREKESAKPPTPVQKSPAKKAKPPTKNNAVPKEKSPSE